MIKNEVFLIFLGGMFKKYQTFNDCLILLNQKSHYNY